ncbi:MAG: DUF924 domain-containing protein [Alphaproteobacteria bacterium]|nr:DUF924 domain-containing protein [Alphaproteobacteria bacterium]
MTDLTCRVLAYWFLPPGHPAHGRQRAQWFTSTPALDADIARRFGPAIDLALRGRYNHLAGTPRGALALCVLLDQMTRNAFRGSARAFAGDARARQIAMAALARGFDRRLPVFQRIFLYLPFEHSEARGDQGRFMGLVSRLVRRNGLKYAVQHRDIIVRFGRFPHRNAALGRSDTPAEAAYLAVDHPRFGQ